MPSWEGSSKKYNQIVGVKGHHYHQTVVMPALLGLLKGAESVLDLGCGQGVLSRHLPKEVNYTGLDLSKSLILQAQKYAPAKNHRFFVRDITLPLELEKNQFSHAVFNLSLQNLEEGEAALHQSALHLKEGGKLILILNHPCFRIPRQSSWGVDPEKKIQYRRLDRYFSPLKIPIQMEPSLKEQSPVTLSFHYPLSTYTEWMSKTGFWVEEMKEWLSDKHSQGGAARMENRAREEFPLFLALIGIKKNSNLNKTH